MLKTAPDQLEHFNRVSSSSHNSLEFKSPQNNMSSSTSEKGYPQSAQTAASNVLPVAPSTHRPTSTNSGSSNLVSIISRTESGMIKRFIFSSEWNFLLEGVKSIKLRLAKGLSAKNLTATIEWRGEDRTFRIFCPREYGEVVWDSFFEVVQALIYEEVGDGWELEDEVASESEAEQIDAEKLAKSTKIQQLSASKQIEVPHTICDAEDRSTSDPDHPSNYPEEVRYFPSRMIWEHGAPIPSLDEVIPDEVLKRLVVLINNSTKENIVKFVKDLNSGKIYIGAHSEEVGHRAIYKLDNIRKNWDLIYLFAKNQLYAEEFTKYEVSFQVIVNVKKKYFETTLLDNLQLSQATFDYYNLQEAVTIRCASFDNIKARYVPYKVRKYTAAVDFDNKDSRSDQWKGFKYASYAAGQDPQNNTMVRFDRFCQKNAEKLQQPEQQSNAHDEPVADLDERLQTTQNTIESIQRWKEAISGSGEDLQASRASLNLIPATQDPLSEQNIQLDAPQTQTPLPGLLPSPSLEDARVSMSSEKLLQSPSTPSKTESEDLISFEEADYFETSGEDTTHLDQLYRPLSPMKSSHPTHSVTELDVSETEVSLVFLQATDEVNSRKYHSTMAQKAGKKKSAGRKSCHTFAGRLEPPSPPRPLPHRLPIIVAAPAADPIPEFVTKVKEDFNELISRLRCFQGEIIVQIEFGRLLMKQIPRKLVSPAGSEASIPTDTASTALEGSTAVFTNVLTAISVDTSYMAKLKDRQGRSLWQSSNPRWALSYEIRGVDNRSQPFIIEVNGETFETRVISRRHLGEIDIHAIKRHWDFRITATGIEASDNVDPALTAFAETIKKTLYIPAGLCSPTLFFEIPTSLVHFAIHGVRIRRLSKYSSLDSKSTLNTSEAHELQMEETAGDDSTIYKWFGALEPSIWLQDYGYKHLFTWHEATISCPKVDEIFQENKTLELGEEASWTPEKLSTVDTVQSMLLPACEMVKQMDGVGFYNGNEITPNVPTAPVVEAVEYSYW